jgi:predicted MPP superfamily phosphohydrolase
MCRPARSPQELDGEQRESALDSSNVTRNLPCGTTCEGSVDERGETVRWGMALSKSGSWSHVTRRNLLRQGLCGALGLAIYSCEIERHWIEVNEREVTLAGLPQVFDGMRIVQLSDIHLDEYTEPFFLRRVIDRVNQMTPDAVFITGDFVTEEPFPGRFSSRAFVRRAIKFARGAAWECADLLRALKCREIYAVMGNHDLNVGAAQVTEALTTNGITVLRNSFIPIERKGARFWLAGLDDPVEGEPDPELAIPPAIRNVRNEPVVLMCHAPDYVDLLRAEPAGKAVSLMLSGHTHGGQIRLPLLGPAVLPSWGKRYVEGWFRFGGLQLHVNRGIGTVGVPFRLNCPPEITLITLRTG